jgi:phosphate transport system permease protein
VTVGGLARPALETPLRPGAPRRLSAWLRSHEEGLWRWSARLAAYLPLAALAFTVTVLAIKAWPAMRVNGWSFISRSGWNPGGGGYAGTVTTHGVLHPANSDFGAWPLIAGTLQTSAIAVVLALPVSVGAAFALTQGLPRWLSRPLAFSIEALAGIPSVIIGLWGALTLGPYLAHDVYPVIADHMPDVPVLSYFRNPVGQGDGLLTSGIVLALMIVPIIAATTRDLFEQVPFLPKEGAESLGMTDWEVARRVTVPWVRSGIIGATVLGLGRALGETIAVAMISGSALGAVSPNIYGTMTTIAATIVNELDSAGTDATGFFTSTLAEAALILAVISIAVNLAARIVVQRSGRLSAPVGRGV